MNKDLCSFYNENDDIHKEYSWNLNSQLYRNMMTELILVIGHSHHLEVAKELGADCCINFVGAENVFKKVREITDGIDASQSNVVFITIIGQDGQMIAPIDR